MIAELGLLARNGLQCVRMLLWLRFMGSSRGRGEAFTLEVGEPGLEHAGLEDDDLLVACDQPGVSSEETLQATAAAALHSARARSAQGSGNTTVA